MNNTPLLTMNDFTAAERVETHALDNVFSLCQSQMRELVDFHDEDRETFSDHIEAMKTMLRARKKSIEDAAGQRKALKSAGFGGA